MNQFYRDKDGKVCAAKTAFMASLAVCLGKILWHGIAPAFGFEAPAPDYQGMGVFLSPLVAAYWGRSKTKSDENKVKI